MKILIDLTALADNFSGIERFALSITKELIKNSANQWVLLFKNSIHNLYGYILINFGAIFFTVVILTLVISYIYASKKDERKICLCILFFIIAGFCENKMLYIGTNIFTLYIAVALYQSSMKIRKSVLDD